MNFVDPDGRFVGALFDAASVTLGVKNLIDNVRAGNTRAAIGDGVGVVIDVVAAALPVVPGGVGFVRAGAKSADVVDNMVNNVHFMNFTARNFRKNSAILTGYVPDGKQAHHILPQKFRAAFEKVNLNIDDPKYSAWVNTQTHQKYSYKYNKAWEEFFRNNPEYTTTSILEFAEDVMKNIYD